MFFWRTGPHFGPPCTIFHDPYYRGGGANGSIYEKLKSIIYVKNILSLNILTGVPLKISHDLSFRVFFTFPVRVKFK